ncbi:MAG: ComF family protein [Vicinamibacterales bacterium]
MVAVLIAPRCAACGTPLDRPSLGAVCSACWSAVRLYSPPLCEMCGAPLPTGIDPLCRACAESPRVASRLCAAGPYEGRLRDLVHALKYRGRRSLARPLGRLMRAHGEAIVRDADVAVPVPLHWRRRWARGFNQAEELAAGLGPPVRALLRRTRPTAPQVALAAARRWENVRGAFEVRRPFRPRGCHRPLGGLSIVLVDDVTTTGATIEACAAALKAAGARHVSALTAARAASPGWP